MYVRKTNRRQYGVCIVCVVTLLHRQGRGFYSVYKQLLGVLYFDSIRVARCKYIYWRSGIDISKSVSLAVLMKTSRAKCFYHEAVPCDAPRDSCARTARHSNSAGLFFKAPSVLASRNMPLRWESLTVRASRFNVTICLMHHQRHQWPC